MNENDAAIFGLSEDKIRQRAHMIWQRQGCPIGQEEQHWEQARRELENEREAAKDAAPEA
nr:hypothetical protein REQ54_04777 [Rhizobium sp. Q54]